MAFEAMNILTPHIMRLLSRRNMPAIPIRRKCSTLSIRFYCDLGNLYNIGDVVSGVTNLVNNGKDTFASFMESSSTP